MVRIAERPVQVRSDIYPTVRGETKNPKFDRLCTRLSKLSEQKVGKISILEQADLTITENVPETSSRVL